MIQTLLTSIKSLKGSPLPLEDLSGESLGDNLSHFPLCSHCHCSGFMDRIWRTTLKMPQSPQRSMVRSARSSSRTKSPAQAPLAPRSSSALARAASFRGKTRPEAETLADEFAESIVKSVKVVIISTVSVQMSSTACSVQMCMSSLYSEAELPGLSAGEVALQHGRVSGMWKVSRGLKKSQSKKLMTYIYLGGSADMSTSADNIKLTFSLSVRGTACSYDFR